jgi:hypothetical protein
MVKGFLGFLGLFLGSYVVVFGTLVLFVLFILGKV